MAKKSKTQRAKASARRAEKRELLDAEELVDEAAEGVEAEGEDAKKAVVKAEKKAPVKVADKPAKIEKPKKEPGRIATFFQGVRSELRRVTWPSRTDVIRWSGVVVAALLFFGVYVFVLDNWVVTPVLLAISGLGA